MISWSQPVLASENGGNYFSSRPAKFNTMLPVRRSSIGVARIFDWGGAQTSKHMQ